MPNPTPRLRHRDVLRALDGIDALDVVAQEMILRAHGVERPRTGDQTDVVVSTDLTTVGERDSGSTRVLPTQSLYMIALATLAALTVRVLLSPAVVTAAIFGEGPAADLHLSLIARYTPDFSGAVVSYGATKGANLLVIAESGWGPLDIERPRPGVLIINASRRDLPDELLAEVDRLYVDDIALLEHNQHRAFVRWHLAGVDLPRDVPHRRIAPWRDERRIDTDLGHLLTGGHAEQVADDVVLVELIDGGSLLARLAAELHHAANALGVHATDLVDP